MVESRGGRDARSECGGLIGPKARDAHGQGTQVSVVSVLGIPKTCNPGTQNPDFTQIF
jgi:hypothetical protein